MRLRQNQSTNDTLSKDDISSRKIKKYNLEKQSIGVDQQYSVENHINIYKELILASNLETLLKDLEKGEPQIFRGRIKFIQLNAKKITRIQKIKETFIGEVKEISDRIIELQTATKLEKREQLQNIFLNFKNLRIMIDYFLSQFSNMVKEVDNEWEMNKKMEIIKSIKEQWDLVQKHFCQIQNDGLLDSALVHSQQLSDFGSTFQQVQKIESKRMQVSQNQKTDVENEIRKLLSEAFHTMITNDNNTLLLGLNKSQKQYQTAIDDFINQFEQDRIQILQSFEKMNANSRLQNEMIFKFNEIKQFYLCSTDKIQILLEYLQNQNHEDQNLNYIIQFLIFLKKQLMNQMQIADYLKKQFDVLQKSSVQVDEQNHQFGQLWEKLQFQHIQVSFTGSDLLNQILKRPESASDPQIQKINILGKKMKEISEAQNDYVEKISEFNPEQLENSLQFQKNQLKETNKFFIKFTQCLQNQQGQKQMDLQIAKSLQAFQYITSFQNYMILILEQLNSQINKQKLSIQEWRTTLRNSSENLQLSIEKIQNYQSQCKKEHQQIKKTKIVQIDKQFLTPNQKLPQIANAPSLTLTLRSPIQQTQQYSFDKEKLKIAKIVAVNYSQNIFHKFMDCLQQQKYNLTNEVYETIERKMNYLAKMKFGVEYLIELRNFLSNHIKSNVFDFDDEFDNYIKLISI